MPLAPQARYPNEHVLGDASKVLVAGGFMLGLGGIQIVLGILKLSVLAVATDGLVEQSFAILSLVAGVVIVVLGFATLANNYQAAEMALGMALICAVLEIFSFDVLLSVMNVIVLGVLLWAVRGLRQVNERIDQPEQGNALTAWYHHLVPILVHAMKVDGHVDRREKRRIAQICNSMNISPYEQARLVEAAVEDDIDLEGHVGEYLRLAEAIEVSGPKFQLMVACVAVVGADGVVTDEEAALIHEVAAAAGLRKRDAEQLLQNQRAQLDRMTPGTARHVLGVEADTPWPQIEAAHEQLCTELRQDFSHLGEGLTDYAEKRRRILHEALRLLRP